MARVKCAYPVPMSGRSVPYKSHQAAWTSYPCPAKGRGLCLSGKVLQRPGANHGAGGHPSREVLHGPVSHAPIHCTRLDCFRNFLFRFEMPILRIEGKAKLGQNRSRQDILGLVEGLQATDRAANHELAEITQSRVLETFGTAA